MPLVAIYHSLDSREAQLKPCTFDREVQNFCNDDVFNLKNIDLGSLNLDLEDFYYGPTYSLNFMFLALTEAEIAGGRQILPPHPTGRVIIRPSPESVLIW